MSQADPFGFYVHSTTVRRNQPNRSCYVCFNFDSHSPSTRERPRYGSELRPYGQHRYEVVYDDAKTQANEGCLSCRVLIDALESQGIQDLGREKIWLCGEDDTAMFVEPRSTMLFKPLQLYSRQASPSPWPTIGPAGHIEEDPFQQSCISTFKSWIAECDASHRPCQTDSKRKLPTRILDVGSKDKDPHLCITTGQGGHYVALSYAWGGKPSFTTTKATLPERLQSIPFSSLPQTFQDVIELTRLLDLQYLWIDALCIVQDDAQDWQKESGQMATIFGDAYLTVSATSAENVDMGFRRSRPIAKEKKYIAQDGRDFVVYTRPFLKTKALRKTGDSFDAKDYPVLSRGWCLQERLLSSRVLHFTNEEALWDCREKSRCECWNYDTEGRTSIMQQFHSTATKIKECQSQQKEERTSNCRQSADFTSKINKYSTKPSYKSRTEVNKNEANSCATVATLLNPMWGIIIECYTRTQLTYPSDLPSALSGLADRLQQAGAGNYLAGLWEVDLARQLTWSTGSFGVSLKQVPDYIGPSWSFLNRPGPVHYSNTWLDVQHINILGASCIPQGLDKTGPVSDAWIKLSGPVLMLRIDHIVVRNGYTDADCVTRNGNCVKVKWEPDSYEAACSVKQGDYVSLLRMFSISRGVTYVHGETPLVTVSMAMRRDSTLQDVFYRIGQSNALNNIWDDAEINTIILR